ncbi:family 20 glycosylhydrolase [Paramicrobacterium sp. CJ85]|uniref:family 20 glycosylhydrolase n=1 Tax=Paramicrobacterium sp. CJ85 TaxID=3445355 RepID=UPI003F60B65A
MSITAMSPAAEAAVASANELCAALGVSTATLTARADVDPACNLRADAAVGRSPFAEPVDERYMSVRDGDAVTVRARTAQGVFRGLVRELLLAPGAPESDTRHDGPAISWRGLSVDTVRHPLDISTLRRIVDLLALHGMNVLHLHLTDNEGWRAPVAGVTAGAPPFTVDELTDLVAYAERRFIAIVPEIDLPGHIASLAQARPELTARAFPHPSFSYFDPDNPDALDVAATAIAELAEIFPAPYLHIGGDEVFGMPRDAYDRFMRAAVEGVHATGRRAISWQEAVRSAASIDLYQWWMTPADIPSEATILAQAPEGMEDLARAVAASYAEVADDPRLLAECHADVIVSVQNPLYLDRRYAERSHVAAQTEALERVGFAAYAPTPTRDLLTWNPLAALPVGTTLAGVEAAIWGETITSIDDLALLLLPRLALVAEAAWHRHPSPEHTRGIVERAAPRWSSLGFDAWYRSTDLVEAGSAHAASSRPSTAPTTTPTDRERHTHG